MRKYIWIVTETIWNERIAQYQTMRFTCYSNRKKAEDRVEQDMIERDAHDVVRAVPDMYGQWIDYTCLNMTGSTMSMRILIERHDVQ